MCTRVHTEQCAHRHAGRAKPAGSPSWQRRGADSPGRQGGRVPMLPRQDGCEGTWKRSLPGQAASWGPRELRPLTLEAWGALSVRRPTRAATLCRPFTPSPVLSARCPSSGSSQPGALPLGALSPVSFLWELSASFLFATVSSGPVLAPTLLSSVGAFPSDPGRTPGHGPCLSVWWAGTLSAHTLLPGAQPPTGKQQALRHGT